MAYYLGIDGGGTKTRCLLADETMVLADAMTGGSNIVRLGEAKAREALHSAIHQVCNAAKISPNQIRAICIGAAGAARPEIAAMIRGVLAELVPTGYATKIEVVGDTEIAFESAFGDGPGVIVIAGTGSIAYGRDANRRTARAGGWGFAISDEGSGHWIGRSAVSAILAARDRGSETPLTAMILDAWKLSTVDELVQHANAIPPPDFPRLFPTVLRAATESDSTAQSLLADAGAKLAFLAAIVIGRLTPNSAEIKLPRVTLSEVTLPVATLSEATLPIATTGSVFRQSQLVREVFYNTVQKSFPGIDVRREPIDPVEGALARARRL
jgi:glucosamine kinase